MDNASDEPVGFTPRHTVAQKLVVALNIVVALACLGGAGALLYGKNELDNRQATELAAPVTTPVIPATTIPGDTTPTTVPEDFPAADPNAVNFLIAGSDSNPCVDPNSQWAGAADPARDSIGSRSDSIMVMRLDPSTDQAAILSFPRDLWVKIGNSMRRINTAYEEDDPSELTQTLFDNFGITVDHYLQIDFCAFKKLVDAVGGVTVPFKDPIIDLGVGIDIPAGCHTFSGDEALAYVRSRHLEWVDEDGDTHKDGKGDLGRISRQQDFLRRVLQAALERGVGNLSVARALISSLQNDIVTDPGLTSIDAILSFAGVLRDIEPTTIRTYQIEAYQMMVAGNSVLNPKLKGANMKAILAIFQGKATLAGSPEQVFETTTTSTSTTTSTTTTTTTAPPTTTPGTGTGSTTTTSAPPPTTTTSTSTTTTTTTIVVDPEENVYGDIVPDESIQC